MNFTSRFEYIDNPSPKALQDRVAEYLQNFSEKETVAMYDCHRDFPDYFYNEDDELIFTLEAHHYADGYDQLPRAEQLKIYDDSRRGIIDWVGHFKTDLGNPDFAEMIQQYNAEVDRYLMVIKLNHEIDKLIKADVKQQYKEWKARKRERRV